MLHREQVSMFGLETTDPVNFGSVFVPKDISRDIWVKNCLKNQRVSLVRQFTQIDNVIVPKNLVDQLIFPRTSKELGSRVLYITIPKFNQAVAVAIFNTDNETGDTVENTFKFGKKFEGTEVSVSGNANTGTLILKSDSGSNSKVILYSIGSDSEISLVCNNSILSESKSLSARVYEDFIVKIKDIQSETDKETTFQYTNGVGFSYKDEFENEIVFNENTQSIQLKGKLTVIVEDSIEIENKSTQIKSSESIKLGEGVESMVKGESLNTNLSSLITTISSLVTALTTVAGTDSAIATGLGLTYASGLAASLPAITSQLIQINSSLTSHLSTLSKTD